MPDTPKKKLQRFLVNLVEKPDTLKQLKADPEGFIAKSGLSTSHKKILLGRDSKKIKALIGGAGGKALIAMVWLVGVARSRAMDSPTSRAPAKAPVKPKAAIVFPTKPKP